MVSNKNDGDVGESSRPRKRRPSTLYRDHYRHTPRQTQMLEKEFAECRHPNDRDRARIGMELGLTPNQVKFWFQNKRTILKGQNERVEGLTLREENDMLKVESLSLKGLLNGQSCHACKVLTPVEQEQLAHIRQLQADNLQLKQKYYNVCNSLMEMGIPVSIIRELLPPMLVSSFDQTNRGFLGQSSKEPINDNAIVNANVTSNSNVLSPQLDSETSKMIQTIEMARDELMSLLNVNEPFWLKDMTDGRYIIHREAYNATFLKTNREQYCYQKGPRTRFESSKNEAILSMSAFRVAEMLMDSKMRLEYLFPTILTEAFTIQEYGNQTSPCQVGPIKLVYEQMHILTPFVTPREFCFLRLCEKVAEGMWLIVEVSHVFNNASFQLNSPSRAWRLPSGCLIKDVSPGISHVTWVEHVEIEDKAPMHILYKDVFFRGLAFNADRWVQILSRSCHRIASYNNILQNQSDSSQQNLGGVLGVMTHEHRKCIMSITDKMMKRFCSNMNMKNKLDMPQMKDNGICISLCRDQENSNSSNGLIVNVATSFWLEASCQRILNYLQNVNLRPQWDDMCNGGAVQEIACISFGDDLKNSISIMKPHMESGKNVILIQESLVDPLGAVVVYAPIDEEDFDGELNDSWSKNLLPSGFIISKDENPEYMRINLGGASTSRNVLPDFPNGSLVTVAFQVMSYSDKIEVEFANIVTSLISSTVDSIKLAFN